MSFVASLRASAAPRAGSALRAAAVPRATRAGFRGSNFRRFNSTNAPQGSKSNTGLFLGVGAVLAAGGAAAYFFTDTGKEAGTSVKGGVQSAKVKTNFVPTKDDYQKACKGF